MKMLGALVTVVIIAATFSCVVGRVGVAATFSCAVGRSTSGGIFITPGNVEKVATTWSSTLVIEDRAFRFGPGPFEPLLVVPLIDPGQLGPNTHIQITVGLDTTRMNSGTVDEDLNIGITDGTNKNLFNIVDMNNYNNAPCSPVSGSHDNKLVPLDTRVSDQFTLLFQPYTKFGACYTAQIGGYVNPATFTQQINVNAGISLLVERTEEDEQYTYHYIKVEFVP